MKYLGLLAGLVLCLSLTVPASALLVEDVDFEAPTFTAGPIAGQPAGATYLWTGAVGANSGATSVGDFDGDSDQELQGKGFIKYADFTDPQNWVIGKPQAGMFCIMEFDFTITSEVIANDNGSSSWLVSPYLKPDDSEFAVDENGNYYISNGGGSLQINLNIWSEGYDANGGAPGNQNLRLQWRPYGGTKEYAYATFDVPDAETTYHSAVIINGGDLFWAIDGTTVASIAMNVAPVGSRMFFKEASLAGLRDTDDCSWGVEFDNLEVNQMTAVPEPATMLLLGSGLLFGGLAYRKRS